MHPRHVAEVESNICGTIFCCVFSFVWLMVTFAVFFADDLELQRTVEKIQGESTQKTDLMQGIGLVTAAGFFCMISILLSLRDTRIGIGDIVRSACSFLGKMCVSEPGPHSDAGATAALYPMG